jgi:glyoxylase-like metal-dependent hydrolase (beta-lactamase superfamily II)
MRLLPGVHLVGSGWLGFGLSDRDDSHVFLVHDGDDAVLVDAGCGLASERIAQHIDDAGVPGGTVSRILLTHAHPDHAAGASSLAELLGAQVLAAPVTADILRRGDEDAAGLTVARAAGLYPPPVRLQAGEVHEIDDGDIVRVGGIELRIIATPGHAAGHLCFAAQLGGRTVLFSGDLVFSRGRVAVLGTPDTDLRQLAASLRRVAALRPDVLLPGHGTPVLDDAFAHLDAAVAALDRQQLPPPLLP